MVLPPPFTRALLLVPVVRALVTTRRLVRCRRQPLRSEPIILIGFLPTCPLDLGPRQVGRKANGTEFFKNKEGVKDFTHMLRSHHLTYFVPKRRQNVSNIFILPVQIRITVQEPSRRTIFSAAGNQLPCLKKTRTPLDLPFWTETWHGGFGAKGPSLHELCPGRGRARPRARAPARPQALPPEPRAVPRSRLSPGLQLPRGALEPTARRARQDSAQFWGGRGGLFFFFFP